MKTYQRLIWFWLLKKVDYRCNKDVSSILGAAKCDLITRPAPSSGFVKRLVSTGLSWSLVVVQSLRSERPKQNHDWIQLDWTETRPEGRNGPVPCLLCSISFLIPTSIIVWLSFFGWIKLFFLSVLFLLKSMQQEHVLLFFFSQSFLFLETGSVHFEPQTSSWFGVMIGRTIHKSTTEGPQSCCISKCTLLPQSYSLIGLLWKLFLTVNRCLHDLWPHLTGGWAPVYLWRRWDQVE